MKKLSILQISAFVFTVMALAAAYCGFTFVMLLCVVVLVMCRSAEQVWAVQDAAHERAHGRPVRTIEQELDKQDYPCLFV